MVDWKWFIDFFMLEKMRLSFLGHSPSLSTCRTGEIGTELTGEELGSTIPVWVCRCKVQTWTWYHWVSLGQWTNSRERWDVLPWKAHKNGRQGKGEKQETEKAPKSPRFYGEENETTRRWRKEKYFDIQTAMSTFGSLESVEQGEWHRPIESEGEHIRRTSSNRKFSYVFASVGFVASFLELSVLSTAWQLPSWPSFVNL